MDNIPSLINSSSLGGQLPPYPYARYGTVICEMHASHFQLITSCSSLLFINVVLIWANEPLLWGDPGQDLDNVRVKYLLIACSAELTDNFNKSRDLQLLYQSQSLSLKAL